jgi:hypothetical protein
MAAITAVSFAPLDSPSNAIALPAPVPHPLFHSLLPADHPAATLHALPLLPEWARPSAKVERGGQTLQIEDTLTTLYSTPPKTPDEGKLLVKRVFAELRARVDGKKGRVRQNLLGKRTDYCARSVITPDPRLLIDQVGVPESFTERISYLDRAESCPRSEVLLHQVKVRGRLNWVRDSHLDKLPPQVQRTGVVRRKLRDGDWVLMGRQPSLRRFSLMAHRVKLHKGKTLKINPMVCSAYNADFDGDEMNLHAPQSQRARAQLPGLSIAAQLFSPYDDQLVAQPIQDSKLAGVAAPTQQEWRKDPDEALRNFWERDQQARQQFGNFSIELPIRTGFQQSQPFVRMITAKSKGKQENLEQMDADYLHGPLLERFWENCQAGRLSLAQSKIQTGEVGYLERRLRMATLDMCPHQVPGLSYGKGRTVRDQAGIVVCFGYGLPYRKIASAGVMASQALCEPLTQQTLDSFHNIHGAVTSVAEISSLFTGSHKELKKIYKTLGIEAAREYVARQLKGCVGEDSLSFFEHMEFLANALCYKGEINLIGRRSQHNLCKDPLARASYEEMSRNFALAAAKEETDPIRSFASRAIVGAL